MKWTVGPEYDEKLFERLGTVLKAQGYDITNEWSGMGGSQEVSHYEVKSEKGNLIVEAETYIGLTVEGPQELVEKLKNEFNE